MKILFKKFTICKILYLNKCYVKVAKTRESCCPLIFHFGQSQVPVRVSDYAFFDLFSVDWQL